MDEAAGKQISHFVGLRAKLYSYKIEDDDVKKAKGILKNVIKRRLHLMIISSVCFRVRSK